MGSKKNSDPPQIRPSSLRASQRVPTLQQIVSIYTITENRTNQTEKDDLPPSYESVVIALPPPRQPISTEQLATTP